MIERNIIKMKLHVLDEKNKMNTGGFYSFLKQDPRLLFGGYPTGDHVSYLKSIGVKYFIDLTTPYEKKKLSVYDCQDDMVYVNFPIKDNFIPYDMNLFNEFLIWLLFTINVMKEHELMYIHCKGGHGRSGMIMCCILCNLYHLSPEKSIQEVSQSHQERPLLSLKWKTRLCPSNDIQRMFVHHMYEVDQIKKNTLSYQLENVFNINRKRLLSFQQTKKVLT